ncbi:hypothetical protein ABEB36_001890 [Hypothenemus hampei]|uniref:Uncharacterized protein n=1 Tax=Hypothenemus hampei TaxID=57062 RepID=A0ABD1FGQ9_HYPHA
MASVTLLLVFLVKLLIFQPAEGTCDRSSILLGAEEVCWSATVKISDRIQYTTKSVLNFAKEKLGLGSEEPFHPQQCDYYECIFKEMKMLNENGYPNYDKMIEWIDNNVIYNHAKIQYDKIRDCNAALTASIVSDKYFSGDLIPHNEDERLQTKCDVAMEFMKCIASNGTECVIFTYP